MTAPPTRNERRKARTTGAILDAAGELFTAGGVQRTTMEEIAERADVSVGSVYFHFGSKEALYLALVERALEINQRYMQDAADERLSPLQRVLAAGDAYLRFHLEQPIAFRMIALRVLDPPSAGAPVESERRIADRVELLVGRVQSDLEEAIAAGEVRPLDAALVMRFLWGAWNGVIALAHRPDRLRVDEHALIETLAAGRELVVDGLATAKGRRQAAGLATAHTGGRP